MHYENARSWPVLPAPALRLPGLRRLVRRTVDCPPGPPAPTVAPDLPLVQSDETAPRWMWLGHASFLMQLGGENVLIDPVFSTQIGQRFRRHVAPPLAPEQLPQIDTVLITQSRPDHLDPATIAPAPAVGDGSRAPRSGPLVLPPAVCPDHRTRLVGPRACRPDRVHVRAGRQWCGGVGIECSPPAWGRIRHRIGAGFALLRGRYGAGGGIRADRAAVSGAGCGSAAGWWQSRFLAASAIATDAATGLPGVRADRCPDAGADALGDVSALQRGVVCAGRTAAGTLSPGAAAERMSAACSDDRCQRAAGLNWSRPIHPVCV